MLRLNLTTEPRWIDLGHGVRVEVVPLTSGLVAAAKTDPSVESLGPETHIDVRYEAFTKAVGRLCIKDWEGLGDDEGLPLPVAPAAVDALLDIYQFSEAFKAKFIAPTLLLAEEKKGYAPLPSGSSAGARSIAEAARRRAKDASVN
ncbi:MAG: hypothetical protein IOC66_13525 [Burkholderia sp.]|nr:hypothetical protein [Burkholderia sp.]